MGALGRERTFIVYCRDVPIDLPTDLAGVTAATFGQRRDGNLEAALGPVCTRLKNAVEERRDPRPELPLGSTPDIGERLMGELTSLKSGIAAQVDAIRQMMESITSSATPARPLAGALDGGSAGDLGFLEGVWMDPETTSVAYARVVGGKLHWAYCRGGNYQLTGEYYNWKLIDGALFSRFRWLDGSFSGYTYHHIDSEDLLRGGWWLTKDVPEPVVEQLPSVGGMRPASWVRQVGVNRWPAWAEDYFSMIEMRIQAG
jgi:hypothetical protein